LSARFSHGCTRMHTDSDRPRMHAAREFSLIGWMLLVPAVLFGVDGTVIKHTNG
jgi:hypothetical protein